MERDQSSPAPRKHKFAPKAPPRRAPKSPAPKTEVDDEDGEAEQVQYLLRRFNENHARRRLNDEKKSSIQVAFGPGETPSTQIKRYGSAKDGNGGKSSGSDTKSSDYGQTLLSLPSAANENVREACSADSTSKYGELVKKEYREPWDYHNTYYPTTLPWRRPHSGDPELLDEAEFGEAAANAEYNENAINPASELELMEESEEEKMFLFKLPDNLPLLKRASSRKGKEKVDAHTSSDGGGVLNMGCRLEELPGGYMGKMLVYKSGAIKLKLGDAMYDLEGPSQVYFCLGLRIPVSPGSDCTYAQDVAAINLAEKRCCVLGKLDKRAVIDPDVDSLLDAVINLD